MEESNTTTLRWQLIPANQYSFPAAPTGVAVRKGLLGIIDQLRKPVPVQGDLTLQKDFTAVPPYLLEKAAALPSWAGLVQAITLAIGDWAANPAEPPPVQLVIGPPHSGVPEALSAWAKEHEWRVVQAPSLRQLRNGGEDWLAQFQHNQDLPLVIPRLEHLYLRHHEGLALIRQTLDWLGNRTGNCLIGINSWAWAYLNRVIGISALIPTPFCPAACDAEHLKSWLQELASGAEKFGFVFRQSNNGKFVLPPPGDPDAEWGSDLTDFLQHLAAYSRGIPGVAWSIWRQSLQHVADETIDEKAQASAEAGQHRTMWVKSWPQLELPDLTGFLTQPQLFLLHALLLHGGLGMKALALILPIAPGEIVQDVRRLQAAGLIEEAGDRWQVSASRYSAIRNALSLEGYLTDAF